VCSEVQTCIRPSWCHCHSLSLASVKSRLVLPFWYKLTWVVINKGLLSERCCCYVYYNNRTVWFSVCVMSACDWFACSAVQAIGLTWPAHSAGRTKPQSRDCGSLLLGPFYGATAVPSVTRCRCRCCWRRCGYRCAGGVRQWRRATVAIPGEWQCKTGGVRRIAVANGPNIFQMLLVIIIIQLYTKYKWKKEAK